MREMLTDPPPRTPHPHAWTSATNPKGQNPRGNDKIRNEFEAFLEQPFEEQRKTVDQSWLELAYVMPRKALRLALTGTKKDAGQLYQFIMSGAIAKDKRFPNSDEAMTIRLPATLLQAYSVAVIVKPVQKDAPPHIDITPNPSA